MLALFISAALCALWLATGIGKGWLAVGLPLQPLLFVLLAFVGWQWVVTAFAPLPWRSWFGQPGVGEGAGFHTAMLLSYLMLSALWREAVFQRILLAVAAFNIMVMAWLHFDPETLCHPIKLFEPPTPNSAGNWPDYLVFLLAYLWIAVVACSRVVRSPARYVWMVVLTCLVLFAVAQSLTATILFYPAMVLGGVLLWLDVSYRPRWLKPGKAWRVLAALGCLVPVGWLIISQRETWVTVSNCSLPTRALLNQASLAAADDSPLRLLLGHGWGGYPDDLFRNALLQGIYSFHEGVRKSNWLMVDGAALHSHNGMMESLLALGLPGMVLWLLLPAVALWYVPRRLFWWVTPLLLALTTFEAFWFFLPLVLAYQALCWVAVSVPHISQSRLWAVPRRAAGALCVLALVMAWSAHGQWKAMQYGERLWNALNSTPQANFEEYSVQWLAQDLPRGGERFRFAAVMLGNQMIKKIVNQTTDENDRGWYLRFMQVAHQGALDPNVGPWVSSVDIWLQKLLFGSAPSALDSLKAQVKGGVVDTLMCLTKKAPRREDVTAQLFYSLLDLTGGDAVQQREILQRVLSVAPDHRVALYVLGSELLGIAGREEEGRAMIERARALGVEKVYPLVQP